MRLVGHYLLALSILVLGACGLLPDGADSEGADRPAPEAVNDLFTIALDAERDATLHTVTELFGPPADAATEAIPNPHRPGQLDTLRSLEYEGLALRLYETHPLPESGESTRSFLVRLDLLDAAYSSPEGLSVGDGVEDLRELLGEPDEQDNETWYYVLNEESTQLEVSLREDHVHRLTWHFYLD